MLTLKHTAPLYRAQGAVTVSFFASDGQGSNFEGLVWCASLLQACIQRVSSHPRPPVSPLSSSPVASSLRSPNKAPTLRVADISPFNRADGVVASSRPGFVVSTSVLSVPYDGDVTFTIRPDSLPTESALVTVTR